MHQFSAKNIFRLKKTLSGHIFYSSKIIFYLSEIVFYLSEIIFYLSKIVFYFSEIIFYLSGIIKYSSEICFTKKMRWEDISMPREKEMTQRNKYFYLNKLGLIPLKSKKMCPKRSITHRETVLVKNGH
jgi:hypothetical protein